MSNLKNTYTPKFKCTVCGCKYIEVRYKYGYKHKFRYAVCRDFGHGNRLEIPFYIPDKQVERYLAANATIKV